ncbi:MAG: hypothetical protein ACJAVI_004533 [Candidatus Azotimanducaceae bacterium]|jgi:hypothetical protein
MWASINPVTGEITGTPLNDDVGTTNDISIALSDANETVTLEGLALTVINTNDAPTISGTPPPTVLEDSQYSFAPLAADVDVGDSLTYSISAMPTWATFSSSTGVLTGTPDNSDVGIYSNIIVSVIDTADSSVQLDTFSIDVINTNDAPTITGVPTTGVLENDAYNFTPIAEDVDIIYGDSISFSITLDQALPAWLTFDTATGVLSGSPNDADVGLLSNLVVAVSDGEETLSLPAFNLTVTNIPPTISGTIADATEDAAFSYTSTASGGDSFVANNLPMWASINPVTGEITGTPLNDDVGTTNDISIALSDANETVTLEGLALTVINTNDAPTLTGTPPEFAFVDTPYSFILLANDVDVNDSLIFTDNLPLWATLDVGNSNMPTITGTPVIADLGTRSVLVTADDNNVTAPTEFQFFLEVANGTIVNLIWDNPTTYADGSPLPTADLFGYEMTYTKQGGTPVSQVVMTGAGGSTSYTSPLLELGTYTFLVKVFDANSDLSKASDGLFAIFNN